MSQDTTHSTADEPSTSDVTPTLSDEQLDEIQHMITELQAKFDEDVSLTADIETILCEYLHRPITPTTNQSVGTALEICLGFENTRNLIDLLRNKWPDSGPNYLKAIQACTTSQLWQWLRRLLAVYGNGMQEAYRVWNENPDGWKDAERRASFDVVAQRWWLSLMIIKYDGTKVFIEDTPRSMLVLASGIVDTLNNISPDQLREVIPIDLMSAFRKNVDMLFELFDEKPDTEEEEAAIEVPPNESMLMNSPIASL